MCDHSGALQHISFLGNELAGKQSIRAIQAADALVLRFRGTRRREVDVGLQPCFNLHLPYLFHHQVDARREIVLGVVLDINREGLVAEFAECLGEAATAGEHINKWPTGSIQ